MSTADPAVVEPITPSLEGGYDLIAQQLVPGYASLARLSVALLDASPLAGRQAAQVLVAGCGTGAELLEARAQRPDWQLLAIDPSASMLAAARRRLALAGLDPEAAAIQWQQSTVEALQTPTRFDGALSVLVLQSLPDDGSKLAFLTALATLLRPGGQLVLVDLMAPERSPLQQQIDGAWLGFQRASGIAGSDAASEAVLSGLTQGVHPIGSSRLAALVEAAGFSDPAPVFQALNVQGFLLQRLP